MKIAVNQLQGDISIILKSIVSFEIEIDFNILFYILHTFWWRGDLFKFEY